VFASLSPGFPTLGFRYDINGFVTPKVFASLSPEFPTPGFGDDINGFVTPKVLASLSARVSYPGFRARHQRVRNTEGAQGFKHRRCSRVSAQGFLPWVSGDINGFVTPKVFASLSPGFPTLGFGDDINGFVTPKVFASLSPGFPTLGFGDDINGFVTPKVLASSATFAKIIAASCPQKRRTSWLK
jgi:hypothetical protein